VKNNQSTLAEPGEKLQRCPEHHGERKQGIAEIPELLVEQARPEPVGVKEPIVDRPVGRTGTG